MSKRINPIVIVFAVGVFLITFYLLFESQIAGFRGTAAAKGDLIKEHVIVSINTVEGLATYGELYFDHGEARDSELVSSLRYDPQRNVYHLDSIGGTDLQKSTGNLTGSGPIPEGGAERDNINLALRYNDFFSRYYEHFPDIAWLYYTGEQGFINMYPWTSSKEFRYTDELKSVEFYKVGTPENDPSRSIVWTPVYLDAAGKGLMVTLSAPVYRGDDFQGVVSLDLTNSWLSNQIASRYDSYLIDDTCTVLATSHKKPAGNRIDKISDYLKLSNDDIDKLMALQENKVHTFGGCYVYTTAFQDAPWKMITLVPVWKMIGSALLYSLPILIICVFLLLSMYQIKKRRKSEEQLEKKNSLLETTLFSIDEGIIVTDRSGRITLMNKMAEEFTGWTASDALGQDFSVVFHNINISSGEKRPNPVALVIESGENSYPHGRVGLVSKDGTEYYISGAASAMRSENGALTGVVVSFRNVTKEYEQEKQIEGFLELNFDILSVVDTNGYFHKVNKKFEESTGYKSEELEGKSFLAFLHDDDIQGTLEAVREFSKNKTTASFTNRFRCKDGSYKYIEWHTQPRVGKFIYSSARDVTEQVLKTEELESMAGMDQLTGIYNRYYFDSIIKGEIYRSDYYDQPLSMALIDMDHFKKVNDTWGHPVGDEVLIQTARTMEKSVRDSDILVRFGGEEFLLLMPNTPLEGAAFVSEKLREAIQNNPHPVAGIQTASVGVAEHAKSEPFLKWYRRVDKALYTAKEGGRNRIVAAQNSKTHKK
jgi:diguanylate cyclase (GGDEF)-like protein/PAS domain S-box-containing protein